MNVRPLTTVGLLVLALPTLVLAQALLPAPQEARGDLRELSVGLKAGELPTEAYFSFACGSDGGTPLNPLDDWTAFKQCNRDRATGLYEVYYEYDDEGEYLARMLADVYGEYGRLGLRKYYGTKVAGHPVVLSVLFDDDGTAQAIRVVTDQRAEVDFRRNAYLLRLPVMSTFGNEGWTCENSPLAPGETPLGQFFVKMRCEKVVVNGRRMIVEAHMFRKPGQNGYDRAGEPLDGEFHSLGRWEIWNPAYTPAGAPTR